MFPDIVLKKSVEKHFCDRRRRRFDAIRWFKTGLFVQLAENDSLREAESGLLVNAGRMCRLDMEAVSSSTSADAADRRSPEIFRAMFEETIDPMSACDSCHVF